jgi:hypothetical protein
MPAYKALYEQQLKKNKEHEEKIYELETQIVDLVDVREIAKILGEDPEHYMNECCAYTLATKIKEHRELQEENKKLQEQVKKLQDEEYDPDNPDHVLVDADTESEEETNKYDGDDWRWVYGKMIVDNEDEDTGEEWKDVVLNIAGGGDHWENWIMRPTMNYIENKDGLHPQHGKVLIQSSCGKYLSFQYEDYECEGDECICDYDYCV